MIDMNAWAQADASAAPQDNPPADGDYANVAVTSEFFHSKKDNTPWIRTTYKFDAADGTYRWSSLHGFDTPAKIGATKGHVASLGINVDTIGTVEALQFAVNQVALMATVRVKSKANPSNPASPFVNTYVQGGVAAPAPAAPAAPQAQPGPYVPPPLPQVQGQAPVAAAPAPANGVDPDIPF